MEEVAKKGGTNQVLRKQHQRRERGKEVAGFLGIRSDGRLKSIWLIESSALPEVWGQRTGVISPSRHTHDHRARPLRPPSASRRQELQLGDWPTIRSPMWPSDTWSCWSLQWLNSLRSGQTRVRDFWETASGAINLRFLARSDALKRFLGALNHTRVHTKERQP